MQLELAPIGVAEQPPQLPRARELPSGLPRETFQFGTRSCRRADHRAPHTSAGGFTSRDLQLRRGALLVSDEATRPPKRRERLD